MKTASRALSAQDFLKWNMTSPAWLLTFPDQRGEGWEVLARKFSGPGQVERWLGSVTWGSQRDIRTHRQHLPRAQHAAWRWGLSH